MQEDPKPDTAIWVGRSLSALVVASLLGDGAMQLLAPGKVAGMMREAGFAMDLAPTLAAIMVGCAITYAIPGTTVLGAILISGFVGGSICAHVRLGELVSPPEILSLLLGGAAWGGLYLRHPLIRALLRPGKRTARHCSHPA